jgi:hypothetical protein
MSPADWAETVPLAEVQNMPPGTTLVEAAGRLEARDWHRTHPGQAYDYFTRDDRTLALACRIARGLR